MNLRRILALAKTMLSAMVSIKLLIMYMLIAILLKHWSVCKLLFSLSKSLYIEFCILLKNYFVLKNFFVCLCVLLPVLLYLKIGDLMVYIILYFGFCIEIVLHGF